MHQRICWIKRPLVVLVDELDKGWDNSEDAKAFVSGLFQAAIWLNELSPRLTVYISLRQELYDSIPALYDDTQKYRDLIETIKWNEASLLAVASMRIKHSYPELRKPQTMRPGAPYLPIHYDIGRQNHSII